MESSIRQRWHQNPNISPETGRWITVDDLTYLELLRKYGPPPFLPSLIPPPIVRPPPPRPMSPLPSPPPISYPISPSMIPGIIHPVNNRPFLLSEKIPLSLQIQVAVKIIEGEVNIPEQFSLTPATKHLVDQARIILRKSTLDGQLREAGKRGIIELVKLFVQRGACDLNWTMVAAAEKGHLDIVNLMIELGMENFFNFNSNIAMKMASRNGHLDVVNRMVELGLEIPNLHDPLDFNEAICMAAEGGHQNIVERMIELSDQRAKLSGTMVQTHLGAVNFNLAAEFAAEKGHRDVVERLIELGIEHGVDIDFEKIIAIVRRSFLDWSDWLIHHPLNPRNR